MNLRKYTKQDIFNPEDDGQIEQYKPGDEDQKAVASGGLEEDMGKPTSRASTRIRHCNVVQCNP